MRVIVSDIVVSLEGYIVRITSMGQALKGKYEHTFQRSISLAAMGVMVEKQVC